MFLKSHCVVCHLACPDPCFFLCSLTVLSFPHEQGEIFMFIQLLSGLLSLEPPLACPCHFPLRPAHRVTCLLPGICRQPHPSHPLPPVSGPEQPPCGLVPTLLTSRGLLPGGPSAAGPPVTPPYRKVSLPPFLRAAPST